MTKETENKIRIAVLTLLASGDKKNAARILWPWMVQNSQTDFIWDSLERHQYLAIMGHGSASKTFTSAAWFLLDWWSDPLNTALILTSDTIDSMRRRIWSDMKILHSKATVAMPGVIVDSRKIIQHSPLDQKNAVAAVSADSDDAQSKIQGLHTKRVRVIIDEADNQLSRSIWAAISNLGTSGDLKVVALANPADKYSDFGQHCEPKAGWLSVNPEVDFEWHSRLGWHVIRLDGLRSPNILAGQDHFPFLLTNKGLSDIREKKGENSPEWWAYVRAWYPPEGLLQTIFTTDIVENAKRRLTWYAGITPCAACDPAFEGGDACILVLGNRGPLAHNPKQIGVQAEQWIRIKRRDTQKPVTIDFGDQIIERLKDHKVEPEDFIIDCTGNALGLSDYIRHAWKPNIMPVNFGGACTMARLTTEDSKTAQDRFDRFVSELWYVARDWCKLGTATILNAPRELPIQLEGRRYRLLPGSQKISAEKKEDMKKRGLESPDLGDAFCLLVHLARLRSQGFIPGLKPFQKVDPLKFFKKKASVFQANYGVPEPE